MRLFGHSNDDLKMPGSIKYYCLKIKNDKKNIHTYTTVYSLSKKPNNDCFISPKRKKPILKIGLK